MPKITLARSPSLNSILMVEKTIQKYSSKYGKYQLWQKLPKKMMYQTFQIVLDYLQQSGKIMTAKTGHLIWTYHHKQIPKLNKEKRVIQKCPRCEEEIEPDFP